MINGFTLVRSFQGIQEYILDNGLKVLLFNDDSQANITVNITYLVGSRHEGRGEAGMAHLLEHMLFRGTSKTKDVKGALQDMGAQFNATTWFDRTNYFETLTSSKENLEFALSLEADRMVNSLILQEDLDAEMTVVRNEFEMGENNPVHVLHDQLLSSAYRWHNYGKTTIGNRSDIERVPAKTLRKFYENYYQPDNAVLLIAGQFDKQDAIDLIGKYFSIIPKPKRELEQTYTDEPAQDGPREVILERAGETSSVALGYHIPALAHKDHASIKVLFDIIADEPGGCVYKNFIETNKCSEVFSMSYGLHDPGVALCFVRPIDADKAFTIKDELISLLEKDLLSLISEEEVERIKARALKKIKSAVSNSKHLALKLSEAIACGDWRLFFWYKDQIKKVDLNSVLTVLKKYLITSNRTSGVFVPVKSPVRVQIEQSLPIDLDNLEEDDSLTAGEKFEASASNIEKLTVNKEFESGGKVAILSKKTRGQSAFAFFKFRFSNESELLPHVNKFWLLPSMLWRGTSKCSYQQLRDKTDSLMSSINFNENIGLLSCHIKSERKYINDAVSLMSHMMLDPAFSEDEFSIVKQNEIDDLEELRNDPQRLACHELERLRSPWPKGHILHVHTFSEMIDIIKNTTVADLRDAYKLLATNNFYLSIVGDCETDEILSNINSSLLSKAKDSYQRVLRPFVENKVEDIILDTKDKEMAMVTKGFNFAMNDSHDDFAALKLANYMFGENMNSRLMNRIREKEGISYGASSSLEVGKFSKSAGLSIYAMAAPQSVSRAKKAIDEEWNNFVERGVSEEEIANAKKSMRYTFDNMLADNIYVLNALNIDLETKRKFSERKKLMMKISDLSVSDVKLAVDKWWGSAKFSQVVAVDKSKLK